MSRALVLSGGGPVGIAWETGIAAGLASEGVDLSRADRIVGTSAGSVVGARIAMGADMAELADRHKAGLFGEPASASRGRSTKPEQMTALLQAMGELFTSEAPPEERRKKIGSFALSASTPAEEAFVENISLLLGPTIRSWPSGYSCTAVNAYTGEFVEWNEERGVELGRAVTSSCAVPGIFPPITIGDARYVDGGMRSLTNADLAKGHERVIIITLIGGGRAPRFAPVEEVMAQEIKALEAAGATVEVIAPDEEAAAVMGFSLMDPSVAPKAAETGLRQGRSVAQDLRALWS